MESETFIIPDEVRKIGGRLADVSAFCTDTVQVLDGLLSHLKGNVFISLVGGAIWIAFIEGIKPKIEELAARLDELSKDVIRASDLHEGKAAEASRFFAPN